MNTKRGIIGLGLLAAGITPMWAQDIKGVVIDQKSKETLIGAVITAVPGNGSKNATQEKDGIKAVTDIDGNFSLQNLKDGTYTLYIKYVGYKTQKIDGVQLKGGKRIDGKAIVSSKDTSSKNDASEKALLTIALQPDEQQLNEVTVTAVERRNTDAAMIQVAKNSPVIVSNVSAQEISRTQDTNAGEVIRRVPGVRLGAMLNFTFLSKDGNHKYQLKNIFNQLATSRYTWRDGVSAQSNLERSAEYYYRSRTTYNGQLTGKHTFTSDALDWSIGYAYANRHLPDRRRYLIDDALESGVYALSTGNDISREWTQLDEHIFSLGVNDKHHFKFGNFEPDLQVGAYGEYRSREYQTRNFIYNWNVSANNMPSGFRHSDIPTLLSSKANMGYDKLYLLEEKQMRNNYRGHNTLGAGYLAMSLPFGKLGIHAGVRFEHNDMELISNSRDYEKSESSRHYKTDDVFPSLNTTYKISDQHQVRLSYGRSINRPEFREVSSSVYYDFDLASNVQGNTELKNCYVDNLDLRYEWYPSRGELISLAVFYKHFDSPIEWTYTVAGGTDLIYSYKNAKSANNYGVELDIRKNLGFIGLKDFSWSFNGALIKSKVQFEKGSKEENRPMQGQSPYLINTGIFYKNEPLKMDIALLYNRIGKRIIGVGRSEGSTGDDSNSRVPHSYEMPRNTIDFSLAKKFGNHLELKLNVRDLLAEKIYYKQFADVTYSDGSKKQVEEIARCYKPGRNIGLQAIYKF